MKKKDFLLIGIMFTLFIIVLFGIEKNDEQHLLIAKNKNRVTQSLHNQMALINDTVESYYNGDITNEEWSCYVESYANVYDIYITNIFTLKIDDLRKIQKIDNLGLAYMQLISQEEIDRSAIKNMKSLSSRIYQYKEEFEKEVITLERKRSNYWWK
ncbi:hypothetical protein BN1058_01849 [Paraliobacillus sp. PM-2]|uniref:hypothetical protein n=1 Tax=Paraliobacillus sp. PM-2 TaxID=1462524 RepID=UPI00061CB4BB|nr:hypothetical protein [Paraliobacillus sp. PM-2]CQR47526.1 hypothetical protein BN1058_01849 [Paraliobacillus sp. PM-2]